MPVIRAGTDYARRRDAPSLDATASLRWCLTLGQALVEVYDGRHTSTVTTGGTLNRLRSSHLGRDGEVRGVASTADSRAGSHTATSSGEDVAREHIERGSV